MKRAFIIAQGFLMVFTAFFIVSFIYTIIKSIFYLVTGLQNDNPEVDECLMVMAVMVAIILFYIWYKKYGRNGLLRQIELRDVITLKNIGIYLLMGIGCQLFVAGLLTILRPLFETLFVSYDETISSLFSTDIIIVAVYVVILAPIIEELMLRGILFGRLRQGIPFVAANILQAAVFGIYHWNIIQGIYAFALGLLLGYIYERTRTLLAPILVHIFINGSGFLLQRLSFETNIPIGLVILVGAGLLFEGIYLFKKSTNFIHSV